ncbi:MAG TPA: hypothetical protein VHB98_12995 [Chloroflexota bacterium]|jgi:hypothetical protein|nr:hypothetical protein [Chloroflexota bacterium]
MLDDTPFSARLSTPEAAEEDQHGEATNVALAQLALIEHRRVAPLTDAQRRLLLEQLTKPDRSWTTEEIASVPDGTEPALIFHPYRSSGHLMREGSHGHE